MQKKKKQAKHPNICLQHFFGGGTAKEQKWAFESESEQTNRRSNDHGNAQIVRAAIAKIYKSPKQRSRKHTPLPAPLAK